MSPALESTDARNKLEDLSGVKIQPGENPYKALIKACNDDAVSTLLTVPIIWVCSHMSVMYPVLDNEIEVMITRDKCHGRCSTIRVCIHLAQMEGGGRKKKRIEHHTHTDIYTNDLSACVLTI